MSCAKLLICDDHPPLRSAVTYIAKALSPDIAIIEAGNGVDALALLERHADVELVLLDLHMPGMSGFELLPELKLRFPSLPVVVLSSDETHATVVDALERGATGYICKSAPTEVLTNFLERALNGNIVLPTIIAETEKTGPASDTTGSAGAMPEGAAGLELSARQKDVLACLLRGMSNKQICRELKLAEGTVKSHTSAIFRTLNVSSRAQAIIEASRRGLPVGSRPG